MKDSNELFDLCKQVYEATGWSNGGFLYEFSMNAASGTNVVFPAGRTPNAYPYDNTVYPLYTSDYLLEKLPATVKNDFDGGNDYIILYKKGKSWYADYMGQFKRQKSDTPLKALLKLTIKLHEEGLL